MLVNLVLVIIDKAGGSYVKVARLSRAREAAELLDAFVSGSRDMVCAPRHRSKKTNPIVHD